MMLCSCNRQSTAGSEIWMASVLWVEWILSAQCCQQPRISWIDIVFELMIITNEAERLRSHFCFMFVFTCGVCWKPFIFQESRKRYHLWKLSQVHVCVLRRFIDATTRSVQVTSWNYWLSGHHFLNYKGVEVTNASTLDLAPVNLDGWG